MDKFIKLSDYQTLVIEQYKAAIQSNKEEMKRKGLEIKAAIDDGTLDAKFFRGVKSGTEMIKRFAAFNLAASALPNHSRYDVRKLTEGLSPESTINLIKRMMPALNIEDLEMIAITGGYYEDLWPPEHNNRLKLPAEMITKNTLTTTRVISAV